MRKKIGALALLVIPFLGALPAQGEDAGFLPASHEVFKPLLADPRELRFQVQVVAPVSHRALGEVALGDYLGIYRWGLGETTLLQLSVGGGVFGRFSLAAESNALLVADYYGNVPFDWRVGKWSGRMMLYHTSSHLGDDYLKLTGQTPTKHTWDNLRWLMSYEANPHLRVYGGTTYVFRTLPAGGRHALQSGVEASSSWWAQGHAQLYWANDFQSWERTGWNPMWSSQWGVRCVRDPKSGRAISLFMGYAAGRLPHGQFYLNQESRWTFGVKFDLS